MAGMFYSLQEAAGKLNKTEEEIKEIVREGRLREFRDGPNLLFKVDEVEALMADTSITAPKESAEPSESAPSEQQTEKDEVLLGPEPEPESAPEPELKSEPKAEPLLEPEVESTEEMAGGTDLTGADTALTTEGINVLGETDSEYKLTDDTMGETRVVSDEGALDSLDQGSLTSSAGEVSTPSDEISLEDIEEDVNLDSFGSGSGLLDLSLQADDTSLGGILDEIYTPESEQEQKIPEPGSAVTVGHEEMLAEEGLGTSEVGIDVRPVAAQYVEATPDTVSNAFGIMLILPLLAVIYTAIVVVAGFSSAKPVILEQIQGIIWYVMIAAVVASFLIIGVPFALAGKSAGPKAAKEKKVKKPKAKKEKAKKKKAKGK